MKEGRIICSGIRVKKQKYYEEFIQNFHKKLKIGEGPHESSATPVNETVTSLVPYKNPINNPISKTFSDDLFKTFDNPPTFQNEPYVIPRNHLKIEHMFHDKDIVKTDFMPDEKEEKVVLD